MTIKKLMFFERSLPVLKVLGLNPNGVTTYQAEVPLSIGTSAFCCLGDYYQ